MKRYYLLDGSEVTKEQIQEASTKGNARIVYGRGENCTTQGLMLDGVDKDTRGECHSMWEEVWTTIPTSIHQCYSIAGAN